MTFTLRRDKGSALTYDEMDDNFLYVANNANLDTVLTLGNTANNSIFITGNLHSTAVVSNNITSQDSIVALGAAFHSTFDDDGPIATGTYTPQLTPSNWKFIRNAGNFTFAAPASVGDDRAYTMVVYIWNQSTPGTITMSGFSRVTGDSFTNTVGHVFFVYITVFGGGAKIANVVAAQ